MVKGIISVVLLYILVIVQGMVLGYQLSSSDNKPEYEIYNTNRGLTTDTLQQIMESDKGYIQNVDKSIIAVSVISDSDSIINTFNGTCNNKPTTFYCTHYLKTGNVQWNNKHMLK